MLGPLQRAVRATGADPPWSDPRPAHPGVALESWFWRFVTSAPGAEVVLLAVTACHDEDGATWWSVTLAGRGPRGGRHVGTHLVADAVASTSALSIVGDGLALGEDGLEVALGEDRLAVRFADRHDWPAGRLGGLGLGHVVPRLTQYWHPHLLGATVTGRAVLGGRTVVLDGATAYGEKNWGRGGTPPGWWWGQGALPAEDAVVAFAGGTLRFGPARVDATALAARVGDTVLSCTPPLGRLHARRLGDRWRVAGRDGAWTVQVDGRTRTTPFVFQVPVAGGPRRTAPLSHQHQDAELAIEVRRRGALVVAGTAELAGLELGGDARA